VSTLRDAIRSLKASPLVTCVVILSLALGIGANSAMFSIVDALVLRDLPVRNADRLVMLFDDVNGSGFWSHPVWDAVKRRPELFDRAFAFSGFQFNLADRGEVDPADGLWASGGMFETMGIDALHGRTFNDADDVPGGGPEGAVAVISHAFWVRRYAADPSAVGKRISLSGTPFTIIGITGPRFFGPEVGRAFDVVVPLNSEPLVRKQRTNLQSRGSSWLQIMIRLAPGESAAQATDRFRSIQPLIADETRPTAGRPQDLERHLAAPLTVRRGATVSGIRDQYQRPLMALMAIVGLTLLIACGNIANLLLARATSRRHEISVRSALGASSARLGRLMLAESAVLAASGSLLGLVVAFLGSRFLVAQISSTTNRVFNRVFVDVGLDWRVIAFTGAVATLATLLFGVGPALRTSRVPPIEAMKERGRGSSSGRHGLAGTLVAMQVALSLVLLIGAGLFVRTFTTLTNREMGIDPSRTLAVDIGTERAGTDSAARREMYARLVQATLEIPGVSHAALSTITPVSGSNSTRFMAFPGRPELPEAQRRVWINMVSPGWFDAVGMRVATGRDFDDRDRVGAARTVIVNEAFARKYFAGLNPIGQVVAEAQAPEAGTLEIVGVVRDAVYRSLREPVPPTMYWNLLQQVRPGAVVALMVRAPSSSLAETGRRVTDAAVRVNPELTTTVRSLGDVVDAAVSQERLVARLSGFFGLLALILAALGLYGVTSYSVTQRNAELGIRMALGTPPDAIARLVLRRVAALLAIGLAAGALVSWWSVQLVQGLLFGLEARDLPTMAGAASLLTVVALLSGWLPARRAAAIDPAQVLRD
jgi:predicted permease